MKARQNPLNSFETFVQRLFEGTFARIFPSRLEPVEVSHKLERAMEDHTLLQSEGRHLAPSIYDIYLSIKDHQQMSATQAVFIREWQNELVEFARRRRYTLRMVPILRLHADSSLRTGMVRVEVEIADSQSSNADGIMATQALSAEQLAQLRAALPQGQSLPGLPPQSSQLQSQVPGFTGAPGNQPQPSMPVTALPKAWLTISLAQAGQQVFRIEKPVVNIGRQLSNDIIVEDKRVSRYHAQIKYQPDGQFVLFDLGSTNGITINNTPNQRQHVLRNSDRFTIGSYDFYFERR